MRGDGGEIGEIGGCKWEVESGKGCLPNSGQPGYYICDAHGMITARQGSSIGFISGYAWLAVLREEEKKSYSTSSYYLGARVGASIP